MGVKGAIISAFAGVAMLSFTAGTVPSFAQDWSGLYIGAHAGGGMAVREGCTSWSFSYIPEDCEDGSGPYDIYSEYSGWLVGKQVGFNTQSNSTVWGGELAVSAANLSNPSVDQWGGTNAITGLLTATGRVGFVTGNALIFGEAGVAGAMFHYGPNGADCEYDSTLLGGVVGGGVEFMLSDNISAFGKVQGLFFRPSVATCGSPASPYSYSETQTRGAVAKVGINWHPNN